ncbi:CHAT domain-containing tetratricopeptide repeat protein [Streptomyces sp. NPDC047070]|uniref:CHAT domain-containing protein n=1 Tax=Streptomyces sp. NPDC047070 TaxID=3154923 RepID=UPI0034538A15
MDTDPAALADRDEHGQAEFSHFERLQQALDDNLTDKDELAGLEDEAVRCGRELLRLPLNADTRRRVEVCLTVDLVRRYRRRGATAGADLDEAIALGRARVDAGDASAWVTDRVNLASALLTSFEERERSDHLQECVLLLEPALADEGIDDEGRAVIARNLATAYSKRFALHQDAADLERAVTTFRTALTAPDAGAGTRANVAQALLAAHATGAGAGIEKPLDEAIAVMRDEPSGPIRAEEERNWWDARAQVKLAQFEREGHAEHLQEAGVAMARALSLLPAEHPGRAGYLGTAAVLDFARYGHHGDRHELDTAITRAQTARTDDGLSPQDLAILANQICLTVTERFEQDGNRDDLDQAISLAHEALGPGIRLDIEMALRVNLAHALHQRFELTHERQDLTEGIRGLLRVLRTRKAPSPQRAVALAAAGSMYESKALALWSNGQTRSAVSDLDQAIRYAREALKLTPKTSPDAVIYHTNLASRLSSRAELTDSPQDFEEAISCYEKALDQAEDNSSAHARIAYTLGCHYASRAEHTGPPDHLPDLQRACDLWDEALAAKQPYVTQFAGHRLGDLAFQFELWDKCEQALALSLDAARILTTLRPRLADQERARLAVQGTAAMAALAAVHAAAPKQAVVHLEQAAATLLAETAGRPADTVTFDDVVAAARRLGGPLVYWAATYAGGLALIVTCDGTVTPVLLDVTTTQIDQALTSLREAFDAQDTSDGPVDTDVQLERWNTAVRDAVNWTWHTLVADVMTAMDAAGTLTGTSATGIVPVGRIAALPLTTARTGTGQALFERTVPCFLPNARSISSPQPWPAAPTATVICDAAEGTDRLPAITAEAHQVASCYRHAEELVTASTGVPPPGRVLRRSTTQSESHDSSAIRQTHGADATDTFLSHLRNVDVAHVACHFTIDFEDPLNSVLRYKAGVRLANLFGRKLDSPVHLVLGVCDAALTGTYLPDEAIGPAPLLLAAGARSVLAALWPVDDETAPDLMTHYHRRLAQGEPPASALAHTQRTVSATLPLALWASFIHVGP